MDLNYLFYRHQILLVRAADADANEERESAAASAERVGCLIERYRDARIEGPRIPLPTAH